MQAQSVRRTGRWVSFLLLVCLAATLTPTLLLHAEPATQRLSAASASSMPASSPATAPATASAPAENPADGLVRQGIERALSGSFGEAMSLTRKALDAQADNADALRLKGVLQEQLAQMSRAESQRKDEFDWTVRQVQLSLLSLNSQDHLKQAGLDAKLRFAIAGISLDKDSTSQPTAESQPASDEAAEEESPVPTNVAGAYHRAATSDELRDAMDETKALALRKRSTEALTVSLKANTDVTALLQGDDSEFAKAFREVSAALDKNLRKLQGQWNNMPLQTQRQRSALADEIDTVDEEITDCLVSMEVMVSNKPWLMALIQARMARELVSGEDLERLPQQPWYANLLIAMEGKGKSFASDQKWSDALAVYSQLEELAPLNTDYRKTAERLRKHVRVLRLYGEPHTGEDDLAWQERTSGVDIELVRSAITQLNENYVDAPDYLALTQGALESIRVLAETPEAAKSFPSLADDEKRQRFLQSLSELEQHVQATDRQDPGILKRTLNNVVSASGRSVDLPLPVLAVEFAEGFLQKLDKFSSLIWPADLDDFNKQTMGQFPGVGIQITKEAGEPLRVVSPLEDSPAFRAGIKSDDLILAVDGEPTEKHTVNNLVKRITGPEGTKVVLTVKRQGEVARDVELVRAQIMVRTVKGWRRSDGGSWNYMIDPQSHIGYVRLTQFTRQTIQELRSSLQELHEAGMRGLVLDLRFNPGGMLTSAGQVSDEFLSPGGPNTPKDQVIVSTRGRQTGESKLQAHNSGSYSDGNMVVLVNGLSASAAEIVSGALKDWKRAIVVGQRSYGKGSVQNVIYLRDKTAALKATTAYYYLPLGRCLHRKDGDSVWGVDPDVEVMLTPRQVKRWLDIRRRTELLKEFDSEQLDKDMAAQYDQDVQLSTAISLLKIMQMESDQAAKLAHKAP